MEKVTLELNVLLEMFFMQLLTVGEYINDSEGKVPTTEYVNYILFDMHARLEDFVTEE